MNRVVNLKISTKGRYALRLMVDLAQCKQGENVALKEVAARQGISLNTLNRLLPYLQRQVMCSAQEVQTEDIVLLMNPNIILSV